MSAIAFIGFGEAARAFATGIAGEAAAPSMRFFDIRPVEPGPAEVCSSAAQACAGAALVFSLVTADQAETAARAAAPHLATAPHLAGALFLDANSCAPDTKRRSASRIEAAGGRYVDVAVMTPVHPKLHRAPCLLAGPHAEAAREAMEALGMDVTIAGPAVGDASTRKMVRSVMVKGLEALTLECFLAARAAGIEDDILASLDASYPGFGWPERAPYMIERAMTHGLRRAAEMREVAQTLTDLGVEPHVTRGTVERQQEAGGLGLDAAAVGADDLRALTSALLDAMKAAGAKGEGGA